MRISDWSSDVCSSDLSRRRRRRHLYDMSDSWQHTLRLEKTLAADPAASYPRLVDGAGCCLPADCSGTPGSYDFLEAIRSEARSVGTECVSTCSSRWLPDH